MPDIRVRDEQGNIHVFPDGSTPEMIAKAMGVKPPSPYDALAKAETLTAPPKFGTKAWWKEKAIQAGFGVAEALPATGATIGGIVGATGGIVGGPTSIPAGVGGAGIGGMAGEAGKQLLLRSLGAPEVPATSEEAAKDITKQGLVQAGIQLGGEVTQFLASPARNLALRQYERALAPTTKVNKAIAKKITPELIERGEYGSLKSLEERAASQAQQLKGPLDVAYSATPAAATVGSGTKIIQSLETLKTKYTVAGIPANPTAVKAISGVQDIVQQFGPDIPPNALRKLKHIFDEPVALGGGYGGTDLGTKYTLKAQKEAANSIREIMGQASPDVARLNKEISFWLDVQKVTRESGLRRTGQEGGLARVLSPLATGATAGLGLHYGGATSLQAAGGVVLADLTIRIMRSPAWRTMSAVTKDRIAASLARGDVGTVVALATRAGVVGLQTTQR